MIGYCFFFSDIDVKPLYKRKMWHIFEPLMLAIVIVKSLNNNSCELVVSITLEVTNTVNRQTGVTHT